MSGRRIVFVVFAWLVVAACNGKTLVLVDPFTPYLSGLCREYCKTHDIEIVEAVSAYSARALTAVNGTPLPAALLAPEEGEESEWLKAKGLTGEGEDVLVISESDAGVATAERLQAAVSPNGRATNGISHHLRNKYEQNQRAAAAGLPIVAQALCSSWVDAETFISELPGWADGGEDKRCVIKPYRGVASDGVHLCTTLAQAKACFQSLLGAPKYGAVGERQEAVLVQEFAEGEEYAVDTVTCDGETKVVALWRYSKFPANGAPFVYQCSELVGDADTEECRAVMDYTVKLLAAQGLKFGPTHTEVKYSPTKGPRLMEINARWHAQHFSPITRQCLGNDAVELTMEAFFRPDNFAALPDRPASFPGRGLILHLVSFKEGRVVEVRHADTLKDLRSSLHVSLDVAPGAEVVKTVDIRTDCGYVLLAHKDANVVSSDYDYIVNTLQPDLFVIEEDVRDEEERKRREAEGSNAPRQAWAQADTDGEVGGKGKDKEERGAGEADEAARPTRRFSRSRRRLRSSPSQAQEETQEQEQEQEQGVVQQQEQQPVSGVRAALAGSRLLGWLSRTVAGSAALLVFAYLASLAATFVLPFE